MRHDENKTYGLDQGIFRQQKSIYYQLLYPPGTARAPLIDNGQNSEKLNSNRGRILENEHMALWYSGRFHALCRVTSAPHAGLRWIESDPKILVDRQE